MGILSQFLTKVKRFILQKIVQIKVNAQFYRNRTLLGTAAKAVPSVSGNKKAAEHIRRPLRFNAFSFAFTHYLLCSCYAVVSVYNFRIHFPANQRLRQKNPCRRQSCFSFEI